MGKPFTLLIIVLVVLAAVYLHRRATAKPPEPRGGQG